MLVGFILLSFFCSIFTASGDYPAHYASGPRFKALIIRDPNVEEAHIEFDKQAINFFKKLTVGNGFTLDVLESFDKFPNSYDKLKGYSIVICLNSMPWGKDQRSAFEKYMENGGGWIGFHAAAYNDDSTDWDWLNKFLGCGKFYCNNWPPQPALVVCDQEDHPVTNTIPKEFVCPSSEFYQWDPSPRENPDVDVLVTISEKMYPFGIKDVVDFGDFPIVWTNNKYRMVYFNVGHGDETFIDATHNLLVINAFRWVVSKDPSGDPFKK